MNKRINIFNGSVSMELPEDFEPCDFLEDKNTEAALQSLRFRVDRTGVAGKMGADLSAGHFVQDAMFRHGENSYVIGYVTGLGWGVRDLDDRLDDYYQRILRMVPMVDNAETSVRRMESNGSDAGDADVEIGMLQYTYGTLESDWLAFLLVFPVEGREAMLAMACCGDQMMVDGMAFMNLTNTLSLTQMEKESDSDL